MFEVDLIKESERYYSVQGEYQRTNVGRSFTQKWYSGGLGLYFHFF
jgi:hypothetical protein